MPKTNHAACWYRYPESGGFLVAAFILISAALALRPTLQALARYYAKEPIAIRQPLKNFDVSRLPSFKSGWKVTSHSAPVEDLGTDEYVHLSLTQESAPENSARTEFFVTYYSDPRDMVPHTPDVCGRQAGAVVKTRTTIMIDTPQLAPAYPQVKGCLLVYQNPGNINVVDIYVFCAQGKFCHTRNQVRLVVSKPGNRHIYFSKIEAAGFCPATSDPDQVIETCKKLLREALPILLAEYFPDQQQLKHR